LNCPLADIDLVKSVMDDPLYVGPGHRCLTVSDPTYADAQQKIHKFLAEVGSEDTLLFYFSGHGIRDQNNSLFLCMRNSDEAALYLTAIGIQTVISSIEQRKIRRALIVLDCCYSGAVGSLLPRGAVSQQINDAERSYSEGKGIYIFSAAGAHQTAKEGTLYGIFTEQLVSGIRTGDADIDGDGEITVGDIAHYLPAKVRERAPQQDPVLSSKAASGKFAIAVNRALKDQRDAAELEKLRLDAERILLEQESKLMAKWSAARKRLVRGVSDGLIRSSLLAELDMWFETRSNSSMSKSSDIATGRVIEDFGRNRIDAIQFSARWQDLKGDITQIDQSGHEDLPAGSKHDNGHLDSPVGKSLGADSPRAKFEKSWLKNFVQLLATNKANVVLSFLFGLTETYVVVTMRRLDYQWMLADSDTFEIRTLAFWAILILIPWAASMLRYAALGRCYLGILALAIWPVVEVSRSTYNYFWICNCDYNLFNSALITVVKFLDAFQIINLPIAALLGAAVYLRTTGIRSKREPSSRG
jgi:hypothetical protein